MPAFSQKARIAALPASLPPMRVVRLREPEPPVVRVADRLEVRVRLRPIRRLQGGEAATEHLKRRSLILLMLLEDGPLQILRRMRFAILRLLIEDLRDREAELQQPAVAIPVVAELPVQIMPGVRIVIRRRGDRRCRRCRKETEQDERHHPGARPAPHAIPKTLPSKPISPRDPQPSMHPPDTRHLTITFSSCHLSGSTPGDGHSHPIVVSEWYVHMMNFCRGASCMRC